MSSSDCPCRGIPSMTVHSTHAYLRELGRSWRRCGSVVEIGCWLGASTASLLAGLLEGDYDLPYYCHDGWCATPAEVELAGRSGISLHVGQDLQPLFEQNVAGLCAGVVLRRGEITRSIEACSGDGPVEICLLDAPKTDPLFSRCMEILEPLFVPGVTTLGLLDYGFHKKFPGDERYLAPVRFIESRGSRYSLLAEWPDECSCAFFRYRR